jgi:hypothetical protein
MAVSSSEAVATERCRVIWKKARHVLRVLGRNIKAENFVSNTSACLIKLNSDATLSSQICHILFLFIITCMYSYLFVCRSQWPLGRTVFARSDAELVGSNPTQGMDVCVRLFCLCAVLCVGSGLATG